MFRELRKKGQLLSRQESEEILQNGSCGVLALLGDGGYPYAVPLSYVHEGEKIYFHCAKGGHKWDAVRQCPKASFCVIGQDNVVPEEYTSYFRSVIVFGTVRVLEDEQEIRDAIEKLAAKYYPSDTEAHRNHTIAKEWKALGMMELTIEHLSGKEAVELARGRAAARTRQGALPLDPAAF